MVTTFPGAPPNPLGLKVEVFLNSAWTDITLYAQRRGAVKISGFGRTDWSSTIQAASLSVTLKNTDGRFSPKNTAGAYYPYIQRNTQIRISVSSQSSTGVSYTGFRFWGEVYAWPPKWDPSQRDVYVTISASGIWRRLSQQTTTLGSAYRRYYLALTGGSIPQAYWPMEDGNGASVFVPYIGASVANASWIGKPSLSSNAGDFPGSDGIAQINGSIITATVPASGTATDNCTRFLISVPVAGDSGSGSTNWNLAEIDSAGTIAKFEVYVNFNGTLGVNLRNSGGTILASGSTTTNVQGKPVIASCELTGSGTLSWAFRIITPGAAGITESLTGTVSGSMGRISSVVFNRAAELQDTAIGHLSVTYGAVPSMVTAADAVNGHVGEKAMDRFTRLCAEVGIATETIGTASTTAAMGPQVDDTLTNLLQMIEDTDCGLLYETRDQFGLGYRSNGSMANQSAALALNYAAATIDQDLTPTYDDQLTKNNVTISNWTGYTQQAILTAGGMSILNPPNGIGNGYNYQRSVCAAADSQVPGIATFLLNLGSNDEIRLPVITVKMIRATLASFYASIPGLRPGDYFQITSPPSFLTGTTIKQLVWGWEESLDAKDDWTISFNTTPETAWETGFSPGTIQTAQIPGGSATFSSAPGSTAPPIINGSITPGMLSNGITIHTLGGNAVTTSASAPSNPNTGDMWINSSTGLISEWNGTSWAAVTFNATNTIQAGTIISSLIAAGTIVATNIAAATITASLLAAGIIVAGIVDATTITGATIVATGSSGEILVYSGTPASGNLIASISGASGTDAFANAFAEGVEVKAGGLVLDNQSSPPSSVSGAAVFYSSTAGRPRYLSSVGTDSVLERSTVNVAQFTVGNTGTATIISAPLGYAASEGTQSSEYEIEIDGIVTVGSGAAQSLAFQMFSDAVALGPHVTIGAVMLVGSGVNYYYSLRTRLAILTSTTVIMTMDGNISKAANAGSESSFPVLSSSLQAITNAVSWASTSAHTLQMYATWGGTNTSQGLTTYRTKIARRM